MGISYFAKGVRPWDASIAPQILDFFGGDLQGSSITWTTYRS